jgi:hypothetical protein
VLRALYELIADELQLLDVQELMKVQIHGDDASYPEPGGGRDGYNDTGSQTMFINAVKGLPRDTLAHEAVHQILYMTTKRTKGARGAIPAWLDEGLADYVKYGIEGKAGRLKFTPGVIVRPYLRAQAEADKPYDISRVLNLERSDFFASTDTQLKYAQAWSLLHFWLHGQGGARRDSFFEFLRRAYRGQSSMTEVRDVLEMDLDDFEEEWFAYVEEAAR